MVVGRAGSAGPVLGDGFTQEEQVEQPQNRRIEPRVRAFSGTAAKNGDKSSNPYRHYSLLKLIETVQGGGSLGQGDVAAPSPTEFLRWVTGTLKTR